MYLTDKEIWNLAPKTRAKVYDVLNNGVIEGDHIVHKETGEIIDLDLYAIDNGRIRVRKSKYKESNYEDIYRRLKGISTEYDEYGVIDEGMTAKRMANMCCNLYKKSEPFVYLMCEPGRFPQLTSADLGRLLYLGTFVAWESQKGRLQHSNGVALNYESLLQLIRMSEKRGREFIKKLIAADIITERAGAFYMDPTIFYYGNLKGATTAVRVYRSAVRSFFEESNGKAAIQLGLIFDVLPYLDKETNMLCYEDGACIPTANLAEILDYADSSALRQALTRYEADGQPLFLLRKNPLDRRQLFVEVNKDVISFKK